MMARGLKILCMAVLTSALIACGEPTKGDLIKKAESVGTKSELEKALGKPTTVDKIGPVEKWTYRASDGDVVFVIAGDTVTVQVTSSSNTNN